MSQSIHVSAALTVLFAQAIACGGSSTETASTSAADEAADPGGAQIALPGGAFEGADQATPGGAPAGDVQAGELPISTADSDDIAADDQLLAAPDEQPIRAPEACAGVVMAPETLTHTPVVTMYIVLDNSGSMDNSSKWAHAKQALTDFVGDPTSAGIKAGIQYFHPQNVPGAPAAQGRNGRRGGNNQRNNPFECDGVAHAQSAVEVGVLPAVAPTIVASLNTERPGGNTPTVGALTGGVNFCIDFQEKHPDEDCVVVFVTDGQPNGCGLQLECTPGFIPDAEGQCVDPRSEAVLAPIARAARDDHDVKTYTVGMAGVSGDGFDLLDALAVVGGTDCTPNVPGEEACNVADTGGAGLLQALNLIRDTVVQETRVPCTWAVPPAPDGRKLDPNLVNVSLTLKGVEVPLAQVAAAADCSAAGGGWYFDVPQTPTEIRTCEQTCETVEQNADDVRVDLEFGCATKKAVVR